MPEMLYFTPTLAKLICEQMEAAWTHSTRQPAPQNLPIHLNWDLNYSPGEYHASDDPTEKEYQASENIIQALHDLGLEVDTKSLLDSLVSAGVAIKDASKHENHNGYFGSDLYSIDLSKLKKIAS